MKEKRAHPCYIFRFLYQLYKSAESFLYAKHWVDKEAIQQKMMRSRKRKIQKDFRELHGHLTALQGGQIELISVGKGDERKFA